MAERIRASTFVAWAVTIAALVTTGLAWSWRDRVVNRALTAAPIRVAVLPFDDAGDSTHRFIADGFTAAVRDKLAAVPGIEVIAATSSSRYRGTAKTAHEVATDLQVRYLLTGSLHWTPTAGPQQQLTVDPQLVDVTSGGNVWSAKYDTVVTGIFRVESTVAGHVVTALGARLDDGAQHALDTPPTSSVAAYEWFLRGQAIGDQAADALTNKRALAAYQRAVALDPTFALAWSALSTAQTALWAPAPPTADSAISHAAHRAADRALALAPTLANAHGAMARYDATIAGDNPAALREYEAALRYAPNDPGLLVGGAITDRSIGRWDDAIGRLTQAERVDPYDPSAPRERGATLLRMRHYTDATRALDRALALEPGDAQAITDRALVEIAQGHGDRARAIVQASARTADSTALAAALARPVGMLALLDSTTWRAVSELTPRAFGGNRGAWASAVGEAEALLGNGSRARAFADSARLALEAEIRATPDAPALHAQLALALAHVGRNADAVREGERAVTLSPSTENTWNGPSYQQILARVYLLVGEPAKALNVTQSLLASPALLSPGWLRIDPAFVPLRGDARFQHLVAP